MSAIIPLIVDCTACVYTREEAVNALATMATICPSVVKDTALRIIVSKLTKGETDHCVPGPMTLLLSLFLHLFYKPWKWNIAPWWNLVICFFCISYKLSKNITTAIPWKKSECVTQTVNVEGQEAKKGVILCWWYDGAVWFKYRGWCGGCLMNDSPAQNCYIIISVTPNFFSCTFFATHVSTLFSEKGYTDEDNGIKCLATDEFLLNALATVSVTHIPVAMEMTPTFLRHLERLLNESRCCPLVVNFGNLFLLYFPLVYLGM